MENQHLSKFFKGRNFLTPVVIEYGETENYIYELSKENENPSSIGIYGVTVVTKTGEETTLNKCCNSFREAQTYIETL